MATDTAPPKNEVAAIRDELMPLVVVVFTVVLNLWLLRGELNVAQNLNDGSFHTSMIRWASEQTHQGRVPLDGWYPYLSLGLPQFHHYQSLPHVLSGYLANAIGSDKAYVWTLYMLLATWPLSVYLGARLLGLNPWAAAVASALSPLLQSAPGYGLEDGSYTWRGLGLWTQLWGSWVLPLGLGLTYRAIAKGKSIALAALTVAITFACNFITGYVAFLFIPVFAVLGRRHILRRVVRAGLLGIAAAAAGSWVIVPLLADKNWSNQSEYFTGFWRDSFGASKVLRWLFTGSLFDNMHLPVITILLGAGIVAAALRTRRDENSRALLAIWVISMLLFFGRPTLGFITDLLPGGGDLMLHRFILAVHLSGVLLAGLGGAWLARGLVGLGKKLSNSRLRPAVPVLVGCAAVAVVIPPWLQRGVFHASGAGWIRQQSDQDVINAETIGMIAEAKRLGGGRVYAGSNFNWGKQYRVGFVPMYTMLLNYDAPAVGFNMRTIQSLSHDVESRFDENNPAHYELFNVRYLILPRDREPAVNASVVSARGNNVLWKVETTGYVSVVDTLGSIDADRTNLGARNDTLLKSLPRDRFPLPTVAFAGRRAAPPTLTGPAPDVAPGNVERARDQSSNGRFAATVDLERRSVVLLKATFHPRWTVTVDGHEESPEMVAPSYVGVTVSPGRHRVVFRYQPFRYYALLIALGLVALAIAQFIGSRRRLQIPR